MCTTVKSFLSYVFEQKLQTTDSYCKQAEYSMSVFKQLNVKINEQLVKMNLNLVRLVEYVFLKGHASISGRFDVGMLMFWMYDLHHILVSIHANIN